jgi:hypothetical protein
VQRRRSRVAARRMSASRARGRRPAAGGGGSGLEKMISGTVVRLAIGVVRPSLVLARMTGCIWTLRYYLDGCDLLDLPLLCLFILV